MIPPFSIITKATFLQKKKKRNKKQEIVYVLNLNLQISFGVHKGRDVPCAGSIFKKNHFWVKPGLQEGAHEVSDSQSKHHEHHTQMHGRGIHRADRFLRTVFRPRGNSQGDRTAKEGQVTRQVKVTS